MAALLLIVLAIAADVPQEAAEGEVQQLQSSLEEMHALLKKAMETATNKEAELQAAHEANSQQVAQVQAEMQAALEASKQQVAQMQAKLAEAAGVLNAKEDLRKAR
jgi:hypothetical protein